MGKKEYKKKVLQRLFEALQCIQDCEKCDKTELQCKLDTRYCVNILLRDKYLGLIERKRKKKDADNMVT